MYKLRDAGLNWDPPDSDYYTLPSNGVLSFDLRLPAEPPGFNSWGLNDTAHSEVCHYHCQLVGFRVGPPPTHQHVLDVLKPTSWQW